MLIIRDLMVRGFRTFKEFLASGEGIASNILADRLRKLETSGIISVEDEATDGRRANYRLTEKVDRAMTVKDDRKVLRQTSVRGAQSAPRLPKLIPLRRQTARRLGHDRRFWSENLICLKG